MKYLVSSSDRRAWKTTERFLGENEMDATYTVNDLETASDVLGAPVPANNPNLMMINPERPLSSLEIGDGTRGTDRLGARYYIYRVS
jgi:hypothetical protein